MKANQNNKVYSFTVIGCIDLEDAICDWGFRTDSVEKVLYQVAQEFKFIFKEYDIISMGPGKYIVIGYCAKINQPEYNVPIALDISCDEE